MGSCNSNISILFDPTYCLRLVAIHWEMQCQNILFEVKQLLAMIATMQSISSINLVPLEITSE